MSPKKKSPWITYNGVDIGDSQLCIEFLMKEFNVDLSAHLSALEKSQARAYLKLVEESLRWLESFDLTEESHWRSLVEFVFLS